MIFRAEKTAVLNIGLQSGDEVKKATVYTGMVTDTSQAEVFGTVSVFSDLPGIGSA